MTDDTTTPDLRLILRNTEKAASDVRSLREALEDMAASLGRRLTAIEASQRALEDRVTTLEKTATSTIFALSAPPDRGSPPAAPADQLKGARALRGIGPVARHQAAGCRGNRQPDQSPNGLLD